jgi:hypothetical protein
MVGSAIARRLRWRALPGVRRVRTLDTREAWPPAAAAKRREYESRLGEIVAAGIEGGPSFDLPVFSFSAHERVPEQVASLRSFLTNVGTPARFTVVSDGSHDRRSRELLGAVHSCVSVIDWERFLTTAPTVVRDYAAFDWRGQKLAMLTSLSADAPLLYTDDDILFFAAASEVRDLVGSAAPRYLRDTDGRRPFLDKRLLEHEHEAQEGINSGFLFLAEPLDWAPALRRLARLPKRPGGFSGQTVVHLTMHWAGARPFDRSRYVVATDDRSAADDRHVGPDTVLRHYVVPVRHKFWTTLASSLPSAP